MNRTEWRATSLFLLGMMWLTPSAGAGIVYGIMVIGYVTLVPVKGVRP